jgi:hypothetical protein
VIYLLYESSTALQTIGKASSSKNTETRGLSKMQGLVICITLSCIQKSRCNGLRSSRMIDNCLSFMGYSCYCLKGRFHFSTQRRHSA